MVVTKTTAKATSAPATTPAPTAHRPAATRAYSRPTGGSEYPSMTSGTQKQPASTISLRGLRNAGEPTETGSNGLPLQQNLTTALLDYLNQKSRGLYVFAPEEQFRQKRALAPYSLEGEIYAFNPAKGASASPGANYRCVLRLYTGTRPRKLLGQWTASANSLRFLTGNLHGDRRVSRDGLIGELGRRVLAQISACSQESEAALLESVVHQLDAGDALGIQVKLLVPAPVPPPVADPAQDPATTDPSLLDPTLAAPIPQPPPPGTRAWRAQIICLEDGKLYLLRKRDKSWEWLVPSPQAASVQLPARTADAAMESALPDGAPIRAGVPLNLTIHLHSSGLAGPGARHLPIETFAVFVRRSPAGPPVPLPAIPTPAIPTPPLPESTPPFPPGSTSGSTPGSTPDTPQNSPPVRVQADPQFAIPLTHGQVWMHAFMTRIYADSPSLWLARTVVVLDGGANS